MTPVYATSGPLELLESGVVRHASGQDLGHVEGDGWAFLDAATGDRWDYLRGVWRDGQWDADGEARAHYYATRGRT